MAFGVLAAFVALSPAGRRSGAHLNPAVTVGFWLRGHTPARDALGYVVAQIAGALLAAAVFSAAWGPWASSVNTARTVPEPHLGLPGVAGIEAALTFGLLMTVFVMVSWPRTARWTPAVVTGILAGLIWAGAPHTGASRTRRARSARMPWRRRSPQSGVTSPGPWREPQPPPAR
jgi:aquaporin Z